MLFRTGMALALALGCASAAAQSVSWITGVEYTSGEYGGSETIEDIYVPLTGQIDTGRASFALTVPYLSVRAPSGTLVSEPGTEPVTGTGEMTTESGLGDIIAVATIYDVFYSSRLDVAIDLTGRIKFGTADEEKGLGTGEQDYTVQADVFKFYDRLTLFGSAGYKFRGDPDAYELEDVLLGSVGGVYNSGNATRVGFAFDYRESSLPGGDALSELSAFLARELSEQLRLEFYLIKGFSDSSPDWGAGLMLKII